MKRIDKWVARDGSEFSSMEDAQYREDLLDKIEEIESNLPDRPKDVEFANGHGYIQHSFDSLKLAIDRMVSLAVERMPILSEYPLKSYGFGRYLDDNPRVYPLYGLYVRLVLCVDEKTLREYGQPYFVQHPENVEKICLNAETL